MDDKLNENTEKKMVPIKKTTKVIISLGLVLVVLYVIFSLFKLISHPTDIFMVEQGNVSDEQLVEGYIIREETVIKGENYKNGMIQIKHEGERVSKDDVIFRYYSSNEEQLNKKIEELDRKIDEAKQNDNTIIYPSDMQVVEKDIDSKISEIHNTNDIQKINEYKNEINKLINKKMDIIAKASPENSYIKELVNERNEYVAR